MRRRFGQYLDKVLDRPRSTSPSGSKSPPETAKDAKAKLYSSTAVSTSLLNHPILKERYQTLRHEGLKNSIADLIGFLEGLDGSIEDYSVLSKLDNNMKELSEIVVPLSEDDNSSMSQRPSEQLAREIVAEIEKARSLTSYSSSSGSFSKTNFAQAISRLSDGLHASIKNYHVDPTCSKGSSSSTPRNIARATSGRVMGALSIAEKMLDGVPVPGLKAAVGGLLEVLGAINKLIDNDDDLIKLINHIERLLGIVTKPLEDNKSGVDISLEQRVRDLAHDIQQITADALKIKEQSLTNKFLGRADNASAIIGLSIAVDRAVDRFQVSGTMGVERGIGDLRGGVERLEVGSKGMEQGFKRLEDSVKNDMELIGKGIGKIETMLDDMEGSRLSVSQEIALNAIHPRADSARYDSAPQLSSSFCLDQTRVELLKEIEEWAQNPNSPPIFWLCGMAGTGKSTIARTVAKRFDESHYLGASFFFSRDEDDRRTTNLVFPTIAYQLARRDPSFRDFVISAATPDVCTAMMRTQLKKLIVEPLQRANPRSAPLVIVMDALDECTTDSQVTEVLVLLAPAIRVIRETINIKVFLTSRPEVHISTEFKEPGMDAVSNVSILHDIEKSLVRADIGRYVENHLQRIAKLLLPQYTVWPTLEEKEALIDMAGGLFIFAAVTIAYIGDIKHRQPKQRLRTIISAADQNQASVSLKYLDVVYRQILLTSLPDDEDEGYGETLERIRTVLGTLVLVLYPLSSRALERLLQWEEDTVEPTLAPFHSILSISPDPSPIRAFHKSFPDFLTDKRRSGDFYIDPNEHHTRLALLCLNNMNSSLRRDMCGVGNQLVSEIDDIGALLGTKVQGHVLYACRYWDAHLKETIWTKQLGTALKDFCQNKLLYWLEIICLDGKLSSGILALDSARRWTLDEASSAILANCYRFLLYYQSTISLGPSHIYQSALPFVPRDNLATSPWEKELDRSPRVVMTDSDKVWDRILFTLVVQDSILSVAYSPNGLLIAGSCNNGTVLIWDPRTGTQIHSLEGHSAPTIAVGFSPDGGLVVSGSRDGSARIWNSVTGVPIHILRGHSGYVNAVSFSPLGGVVASGSSDGTVRIWDSGMGSLIKILHGYSHSLTSIAFSPDGAQIVFCSRLSAIAIWDIETGTIDSSLREDDGLNYFDPIVFSPDGTQLASCHRLGATIWDYRSRSILTRLKDVTTPIFCIAFSPDGRFVVTGCHGGQIVTWDHTSGSRIGVFSDHTEGMARLAVSPDGSRIIANSYDGTAMVWDMTSGWEGHGGDNVLKEEIYTGTVNCLAFSPDGTTLASGTNDAIVEIWDIRRRTLIRPLKGHHGRVTTVAFSTNGRYVASGSEDGHVIIWCSESGESIETLQPGGRVHCVDFSIDGQCLVVACDWSSGLYHPKKLMKWTIQDSLSPITMKAAEEVLRGSPTSGEPPSGTYLARDKNSQWIEKRRQGTTIERLCHLPHLNIRLSASLGRTFVFVTSHGMCFLDFPPATFGITSTTMYTDDRMFDFDFNHIPNSGVIIRRRNSS